MQPRIDNQRVITSDQDIPFGRMVVLSFKWALAAIPAIILLIFLLNFAIYAIDGLWGGSTGQQALTPVALESK